MKITAVDIGGSHITVAAVEMENRQCAAESVSRQMVDSRTPAAALLDGWAAAIGRCAEVNDTGQIAIAMPGPFDYDTGVSYIKDQSKFDALYGINVKEALAERLSIPASNILMDNDASCFLRGHYFAGCLGADENVLGLTLGTGFGSVIRSREEYSSPEYWSVPFGASIADDYFSSRWLLKEYALSGREVLQSVRELALKEEGREVFQRFGAQLASFVAAAAPEVDTILLGGNIARAFHLFGEPLMQGLARQGHKYRFQISTLGEDAMLLGAAAMYAPVSVQ